MARSTPASPRRDDILDLSKEEIVERVLELEAELLEFQESSRELEKALEDELHQLEVNNARLTKRVQDKDTQINDLYAQIKTLSRQLNELQDKNSSMTIEFDTQIRTLRQQLVEVEIANDNMESNDRVLSSDLEMVNQFNSELLEKIALLENDLHHERKVNAEKALFITNHENTIQHLEAKLAEQENTTEYPSEVDVAVLSMRDVLRAGPPISSSMHQRSNTMVKSDSLQKLHELAVRSEGISKKVKNLRRQSLYIASPVSKSPSTTQISKHLHTSRLGGSKSSNKENESVFGKSKTSRNLTTMLYKEASLPLNTIDGSPTVNAVISPPETKPRKRKNLLGNLKALAMGP